MQMDWEERPVYITGRPHSGTTLLLGMLDGHPDLLVYPDETFFPMLFRKRYQGAQEMITDFLFRIPNRMHYYMLAREHLKESDKDNFKVLPPDIRDKVGQERIDQFIAQYQVRGLSKEQTDQTLDIEQYHQYLTQHLRPEYIKAKRNLLLTTMRALLAALKNPPSDPVGWAFKQPVNLRRPDGLSWFFNAFTQGRCIFIVRDPRAWFNSKRNREWTTTWDPKKTRDRQQAYRSADGKIKGLNLLRLYLDRVKNLPSEYALPHRLAEDYGPKRFFLLYYENLIKEPQKQMKKVADFLGVPYVERLEIPTRLGIRYRVLTGQQEQADRVYQSQSEKWRTELESWQVVLIETLLESYFKSKANPYEFSTNSAQRARMRLFLRGLILGRGGRSLLGKALRSKQNFSIS
jgi:hypothetical protein